MTWTGGLGSISENSVHFIAGQTLIVFNRMDGGNQSSPAPSRFIIAAISGALRALINQIKRLIRSILSHEPNSPRPGHARKAMVVDARVTLAHLKQDLKVPSDFIQYFLPLHFAYPSTAKPR